MYRLIQKRTSYRERDRQKALVYHEIFSSSSTSRTTLTRKFKMRANSVSDIVQELIDDSLVIEERSEIQKKKGRPQLKLKPAVDRIVGISIYAEDRTLYGSLINLEEETLADDTYSIPPETTNEDILTGITTIVKNLKKKVPGNSDLVGIGISAIGIVDSKNKIWREAHRWPNIRNIDFKAFEKKIRLPIILRRWLDTELEYQLLRCPECREGRTLLFHWGSGIGAAYSHNGQVLDSNYGIFADVGHLNVDPGSEKLCRCGLTGCLETCVAIWALLPAFRRKYPDARERSSDIAEILKDPEMLNSPEMLNAIRMIEVAFANLFKILLPDRIFFIGPFFENPIIVKRVMTYLESTLYSFQKNRVLSEVLRDKPRLCKYADVDPFFLEHLDLLLKSHEHV